MANVASSWSMNETLRLANEHASAGRGDEALELFEKAVEANPNAPALFNLGVLALHCSQPERAAKHLRKAIERNRNVADYHLNLSTALISLKQLDEAAAAARRALKLQPRNAVALCKLGSIRVEQGDLDGGIAALQRAVEIDPKLALAHQNLGTGLYRQGRISDAIASFRLAVVHNPEFAGSYIALVNCLNYLPGANAGLIAEATARWSRLLKRPAQRGAWTNRPEPGRKLQIGYLSADLRNHPVAHFLENVLRSHDRASVEVTCYCNNKKDDDTTGLLKGLADRWRPIRELDDAAAAALIRNDRIDILVELSGHTDGERPELLVSKPAPIQCSWLGYYATTGLPEIDYIIADRFIVPPGDERFYVEKPWRLPDSYLCFTPPNLAAPVGPLPALRAGTVTYGSCNNVMKVNKGVVGVWTRLLHADPRSRLLLRSPVLSNKRVYDELLRQFVDRGIAADRLTLLGIATRAELLETYNAIDVALDPFPYGGGTTTVEALWMGVPVISLRGDRFSGRVSESMLNTVGLPELVVTDEDTYVGKAIELAGDLERLSELRAGLRGMVVGSPLCDAPRFARHLEAAYREMWQRWCAARENAA